MKDTPILRIHTVAIWGIGVILLFTYLLSIRFNNLHFPPTITFWLAIVIIIGTLVFQIIKFGLSSSFAKVVIVEILITNFAFHMIYQIPYLGFVGSDSYFAGSLIRGVLSEGYFIPPTIPEIPLNYMIMAVNQRWMRCKKLLNFFFPHKQKKEISGGLISMNTLRHIMH